MKWRGSDVTIPDDDEVSSEGIDIERIRAYEAKAVPVPTRLATPGHQYEVRAYVEQEPQVRVGDEWLTL